MGSRPPPPALALLSNEKNCAADAALLESLPHLHSHDRAAAVEMVIRRAHAPTLTALVLRFGQYDDEIKSLISRRVSGLHAAARSAIESETLEQRAGAIELIRQSGEAKLAYLLTDALRSTCPRTRELAAQALADLTARIMDGIHVASESPGDAPLDTQVDALVDALRLAVQRWELHFQSPVIEAALWMGEPLEETLREKLQQPTAKITHPLCEMIEAASDPRLAGAVLRALAIPALRPSAARAITKAHKPAFTQALVHHSWLLADPEIAHGCRWVHEGRWADDWLGEVRQLPESDGAAAVRLFGATGGPSEWKMERFRGLLDAPSVEVRRAVLWQAIDDPSQPATDLLTTMAARTGDDTAEVALRECRRRMPPPAARSGAAVAPSTLGGKGTAADAFEAFFTGFDHLAPGERTRLSAQIREDIPGLPGHLRAKCTSLDPLERCRALRVAKSLGVLNELADEVYKLAHDAQAVVRSAAVGVLKNLPGPTTVRILRTAVNDPDPRVQADAVEALDRLDVDDRLPCIQAKLTSPHSRVRANAVCALLRVELQEAGEVLLDMLEDSSESHRLSALWVIERLRLRSVLHRIFELSRGDPDDRVRKRAQRLYRELV